MNKFQKIVNRAEIIEEGILGDISNRIRHAVQDVGTRMGDFAGRAAWTGLKTLGKAAINIPLLAATGTTAGGIGRAAKQLGSIGGRLVGIEADKGGISSGDASVEDKVKYLVERIGIKPLYIKIDNKNPRLLTAKDFMGYLTYKNRSLDYYLTHFYESKETVYDVLQLIPVITATLKLNITKRAVLRRSLDFFIRSLYVPFLRRMYANKPHNEFAPTVAILSSAGGPTVTTMNPPQQTTKKFNRHGVQISP